jgi:hypothetical protein
MLLGHSAGQIIICSVRVIVARVNICAPQYFQLVTNVIVVAVRYTLAITSVVCLGKYARRVVNVRCSYIIIASGRIHASCDFQAIAHAIHVRVRYTMAGTVVVFLRVPARSVVVRGIHVCITRRWVHARAHFNFITDTIFVGVIYALTGTIVEQ